MARATGASWSSAAVLWPQRVRHKIAPQMGIPTGYARPAAKRTELSVHLLVSGHVWTYRASPDIYGLLSRTSDYFRM